MPAFNARTASAHDRFTAATHADVHRHWSPGCERVCGGDVLATLLNEGWVIDPCVICQPVALGSGRHTHVYLLLLLLRDDDMLDLAVLENPYVLRVLRPLRVSTIRYRPTPLLHR
jgi:hypothetical protein